MTIYIQTRININNLRAMAANTNYTVAAERKVLFDSVFVIKQSLKEIECIILSINKITLSLPAIRMYVKRIIHPQQMEAWITKLCESMDIFLTEIETKDDKDHLTFISTQFKLLDSVIKVLNGDAYLVGCSHSK